MTIPVLELSRVAAILEGHEETIIARLIDRAQFHHNPAIYEPGQSGFDNTHGESLFHIRLRAQEEMDARFGRFCVAEERPFTAPLPAPRRAVQLPPTGLALDDVNRINLTARILDAYFAFLPRLCRAGDDGHRGSSVEHDVYALQAVSRRIHFGAFYVAECKYRNAPAKYRTLIERGDTEALRESLTRREVEERIIERVREKVAYAQARANAAVRHIVSQEVFADFYRDHIIPLTKEGEIAYLYARNHE